MTSPYSGHTHVHKEQGKTRPLSYTSYTYGTEASQHGSLYLPDGPGPHPVVLLIHGGFWHMPYGLDLMDGLARDLLQHNIATWNIEYRRVGERGGGWPGTFLDVAAAADYLRLLASQHALDLQRVVAVGHSAGGHLAFWLAARPRMTKSGPLAPSAQPLALTGAISLAGALDLEHVWRLKLGGGAAAALLGGSPSDVPDRYQAGSPTTFLPLGVRQVLIHGTKDDRVPLEVSEAYQYKALKAGDLIALTVLYKTDHFALIEATSHAWQTTLKAIQNML